MDAWLSDGLHFPFGADAPTSVGGAPAPCPDPVVAIEIKPEISTDISSLVPQITTEFELVCDPGVEGTVIEGLGGWRWAFTGDQATQTFWGALASYGGDLARLNNDLSGALTFLRLTGLLNTAAIGVQRVNKGVRGDDVNVGFFQDRNLVGAPVSNFANPGSQDLHLRLIVKDLFDQGATTPTYFELRDPGGSIFTFATDPSGVNAYALAYGSYTEALPVGVVYENTWTLIDFQIRPADPTTQVELFVNGVDLTASLTQPGSLVADAFTSNPGVALMNAVVPTGLTPALNVEMLFAGIAVGRTIQFARHQGDASALGVT